MKRHVNWIALSLASGMLLAAVSQAAERRVTSAASSERTTTGPVELPSPPDPALLAEVSRLVEASLEALRDRNDYRHEMFLKESLEKLPDFSPARWHSGYVWLAGVWVHVDQVPYLAGDTPVLKKYTELREQADARHYSKVTTAESNRVRRVATRDVIRPEDSIPAPARDTPLLTLREKRDTYTSEQLRLINTAGYSAGYARAQESLARWCGENGLPEEARVHWAQVLNHEPANRTAAQALGMVEVGGRYFRKEQVESARRLESDVARSWEKWQGTVARLRREAASNDLARRQAAIAELESIDDPDSVFSLELAFLPRENSQRPVQKSAEALELAAVAAISNLETQPATESLVRFAVLHRRDTVRETAGLALARRDLHTFVPLLLAGLTMPIEYNVAVVDDGLGQKLLQAGAVQEHESHLYGVRESHEIHNASHLNSLTNAAMARLKQLREFNVKADQLNRRIVAALLCSVTINNDGPFKDLAGAKETDTPNPKRWWEWWYDLNEQYVSGEKPYYGYDYGANAYENTRWTYEQPPVRAECFAKGTPVWTLSGAKPIEQVRVGDRVLAQNSETGELAYKGVLGTTIRPPGKMLTVRSGKSAIVTTRGHPFFVVGKGWRMAKELRDDDWLCAQSQTLPIDTIESAEPAEAYNLVVADFGTYFVGQDRVLVHDNSPISPARLEMPGLLAAIRP
ncbi:MAG: polymorphic toxin-type HINT domain-containing protein [Pirellulales bacterium]